MWRLKYLRHLLKEMFFKIGFVINSQMLLKKQIRLGLKMDFAVGMIEIVDRNEKILTESGDLGASPGLAFGSICSIGQVCLLL